jgi:O-antigen ligase/polysaccharide polymerase Wzy-like membrane protein
VLFWSLLLTVAAMPLPSGSAPLWANSLAAILVGLSLFGYSLCLIFAGWRLAIPLSRLRIPVVLAAIAVAWIFAQLMPIGGSSLAHPIWVLTGDVLKDPLSGRISVDPYATATAVMRLFMYFGIFFLALQLCRNSDRAFQALNAIVVIGVIYAIYGVVLYALKSEALFWISRSAGRDDLSRAFINRHAFGDFVGLGLLAAVALLAKHVHRPAVSSGSRKAMVTNILRIAKAKAWTPVAIVILTIACALTSSTSGMVPIVLAVVAFLLCLMTASRLNRAGQRVMVGLLVTETIFIILLSGQAMHWRFSTAAGSDDVPAAIHELVRQGITDSPLLGHGYGAFESAFQSYADTTLNGHAANAHGDFLQLAFELGIPAAIFLVLAIVAVALRCLWGVYSRRRDIAYPALATAAAVLVGAHALTDSGLQVPATAALFAFILGLGYSQCWKTQNS